MADESVRRALYVLFARLLAGPPDAALYARLEAEGLKDLATVQGIDLTSDLKYVLRRPAAMISTLRRGPAPGSGPRSQ